MMSCQSLAGSVPPVTFFMREPSSLPIHTPADVMRGVADEPGVAVVLRRAGLAAGHLAGDRRLLAGAARPSSAFIMSFIAPT